ncbi:Putative 4,5-dihydroxyphthalate dehydrogenase [Variovorax sp. PBL-H6]|nr:Putative 4,5-dihydroxyphthalate dehydrogenase [Variovorax sp. PBL-H6]
MVNIAVVGLGWWGKIMVNTLAGSSSVRVVAAVEPNAELGAPLCKEGGIRHYAQLSDALQDPEVEAVILTTPNRFHEEQIVEAAQAGKHVLCEKPLALGLASAERAVEACLRSGVRLGIGHERRFEPPMKMVRQLVADGALGQVLQIEGNFSQNKFLALAPDNWRLSVQEAGCGPMTATGIHLLDLAGSIAGAARAVRATAYNLATGFESGDSASAHVVFDNGVTATINAMLSTPFYSRFAVFGSRGWIEVRDKSHVESPSGWIVTRSTTGDETETIDIPVATPVRENVEAFARAVRGKQSDYPVSLQEMLNTTSLLESVFEAARTGSLVVPRKSDVLARVRT